MAYPSQQHLSLTRQGLNLTDMFCHCSLRARIESWCKAVKYELGEETDKTRCIFFAHASPRTLKPRRRKMSIVDDAQIIYSFALSSNKHSHNIITHFISWQSCTYTVAAFRFPRYKQKELFTFPISSSYKATERYCSNIGT
jgi:hypothetical protein